MPTGVAPTAANSPPGHGSGTPWCIRASWRQGVEEQRDRSAGEQIRQRTSRPGLIGQLELGHPVTTLMVPNATPVSGTREFGTRAYQVVGEFVLARRYGECPGAFCEYVSVVEPRRYDHAGRVPDAGRRAPRCACHPKGAGRQRDTVVGLSEALLRAGRGTFLFESAENDGLGLAGHSSVRVRRRR